MLLPGALRTVKRPVAVAALQQPEWPDKDQLRQVSERLAASVGPVEPRRDTAGYPVPRGGTL